MHSKWRAAHATAAALLVSSIAISGVFAAQAPATASSVTSALAAGATAAKAMTAAAGERGYQLVLCVTENDTDATARYLDAMQAMYAPFAVIADEERTAIRLVVEART